MDNVLPRDFYCYLLAIIATALVVRAIMSSIRVMEFMFPPQFPSNDATDELLRKQLAPFRSPPRCRKFWWNFRKDFCGYNHPFAGLHDYWHPSILGSLELFSYPILLHMDRWEAVAGWLAFKTFSRRESWSSNRAVYNRFLIGNAMILIAAFLLSLCTHFFPLAVRD